MKFPTPLVKGTLVQRYKRFMADIILETGDKITAHCANSGSMMGVMDEGAESGSHLPIIRNANSNILGS